MDLFTSFCKIVQNEKACFDAFYGENGISHNFYAPRTSQQNGVVERRNKTLEEMARTMLCENNLPKYFWAEAINTSCYIINRVMIRPILKKTPYELLEKESLTLTIFIILVVNVLY